MAMLASVAAYASQGIQWTLESSTLPPASVSQAIEGSAASDAPCNTSKVIPADIATRLKLTRDGAILTALANNRALAVYKYGPAVGATFVPEARAMFDPTLSATLSHERDTRQIGGIASFTFLRGLSAASAAPTPLVVPGNPEQTVINLLAAATTQAQSSGFEPILENKESRGEMRLSRLFPTGTEVSLSGGVTLTDTNFTDEEFLGSWSVGVNQALLRGAGTRVNLVTLRQARNMAAQSKEAFRAVLLDLVSEVEAGYWSLVLAQELLKIHQFSIELAQKHLEHSRNLVEVGKAVKSVVMAAEAELASRQAELADAKALLKARTLHMVQLLNPDDVSGWDISFEPVDAPEIDRVAADGRASAELALLHRPEPAQARLDLANQELEVVRTKNGLLPRLDMFASYGRTSLTDALQRVTTHLDDGTYENYAVGLTFEMPLLNRAERARHQRAKLGQGQAEAALVNLEQLIEREARQAVVEVERQWERIVATPTAVASRKEALRIEQDRFLAGKATHLDVLQVQRDLIQAQVAEVTARLEYIEALTALYRAEGTLLERRGVNVEETARELN